MSSLPIDEEKRETLGRRTRRVRRPAAAIGAAIVIGALAVAAWSGTALASKSQPAGHDPLQPSMVSKVTIKAVPFIQFNASSLKVDAGGPVTVHFINEDIYYPHNFAAYTNSSATTPLAPGSIGAVCVGLSPCGSDIVFTPPAPGTYYFQCDVHPGSMFGSFVVNAAPPAATPTETSPALATATPTETAPMAVGGIGALPNVPPDGGGGSGMATLAGAMALAALVVATLSGAWRWRASRSRA